MTENFKQCVRCVMDTSDPEITFNDQGVCIHCQRAEAQLPTYNFTQEQETQNLERLKSSIVAKKKSQYDSIIGLSGGVDSSYVALVAKRLGLNPLAVHFDNGWNSETSVSNIKKIIDKCGFDLETYVIDWPEFKDLQRSFFKAGVVDIEMLTDHAIVATMFDLRRKHNIEFVLSGANYRTEHGLPPAWVWNKQDLTNIKAIQKRYGTRKLKAFPTLSTFRLKLITAFGLGGTFVEPLNLINYRKDDALETLKNEFGWQYYGGKHYESVFTKFYQAHYLPVKFGYDKRKVHLSAQIRNHEISREAALEELKKPLYDPRDFSIEKEYVLKKLNFSAAEFDQMLNSKPVSHAAFPNEQWVLRLSTRIRKILRG